MEMMEDKVEEISQSKTKRQSDIKQEEKPQDYEKTNPGTQIS